MKQRILHGCCLAFYQQLIALMKNSGMLPAPHLGEVTSLGS